MFLKNSLGASELLNLYHSAQTQNGVSLLDGVELNKIVIQTKNICCAYATLNKKIKRGKAMNTLRL